MRMFLAPFAALTLAAAPAARAADLFSVSVPIDIKSLNTTITGVQIVCQLTGREPVTGAVGNFGPMKVAPTAPVTAGAYAGPNPLVMVWRTEDFTADQLTNLANVTGGSCRFNLAAGASLYSPYGGETSPALAQRPGTPFRSRVTFTFPSGP